MEIILADYYGFCGGVKRAVKLTEEALENNEKVYIDGMLIHNHNETNRLKKLGLNELNETIEDGTLILRSHGTPIEKKIEYEKEYEVIDTVCPKVIKVQELAKKHKDDFLVILGKKDHPEVVSINSYSCYNGLVIGSLEELKKNKENLINTDKEIIIISQTTFNENKLNEIFEFLDSINIKYKFYDTICNATKLRNQSVINLAKSVDCVLIFGDRKSSNSTKLYENAKKYNSNIFFINSIDEIEISKLLVYNRIGISAGASTPAWIIKEAIEKMEDMNKNEMMEAIDSSFTKIKRGDILTGTVLYVNDTEVGVNINYRADGIVPKEEVSDSLDVNPSDLFKSGDEIEVYVLKMDDGDGNVLLSHKRIQQMKNWEVVEGMFNNEEIVEAYVNEVTKGGLKCEVLGLNAFMPASHVSVGYKKDLSEFLDKTLASKVIDFNKDKRRIILSRKVVEQEEIEQKKKEIYENINVGDTIEGVVQRLTNFGAFVDIGGIDGLIHISQLSWNRVKHPSDVVEPGQEVSVKVLEIDPEQDRVALGLKQLTKEPWDLFVEENKVGDIVQGKVVNLLDFGAFVKLESGVDGLLHVSQISRVHVDKPSDKLEQGQDIEVVITDIDEENKKISLSIKEIEKQRAREARLAEGEDVNDDIENTEEPAPKKESNYDRVNEKRSKRQKENKPRNQKVEQASNDGFGISFADLFNKADSNEEESFEVADNADDDSNEEIAENVVEESAADEAIDNEEVSELNEENAEEVEETEEA